ncbi:MAG: glycosyltransferase family 4 protein [Gemmataceae bacterium]|nr:glycosyltransferase family 4 protein [Gemmataceae bacterium]MDW8265233.1 glycosyltransferase family 4 protein [Gemmataceae bacterium]
MRVAHFIQRYPPALGGAEAYIARLSRFLAAEGDRVTVFTSAALDLEGFWSPRGRCLEAGLRMEDGVEVRRYWPWRLPGRRWLLKPLSLVPIRTWQCLTLTCNPISGRLWTDCGRRDWAFDLVHGSSFPYAFPLVCARRLARRLGVPFLLTPFVHLGDLDDPGNPTRRIYTSPALLRLLAAADRVFVVTELERRALLDGGVAEAKLVRIGLGVDPAECTGGCREAARRSWGVGPEEVVVGHLANNSVEKGTVDLLRAAARSWGRGPGWRLVLAGPEMPNFRRFWQNYPFRARVARLGVLSENQKRDFFAGIDLFALPSRSDAFGLVLLEAWANGKANVAYRAGGPAEVIRHGGDGWLVPCGDVPALADALDQLAADHDLRRRLGERGRQRIVSEFLWPDKLAQVRRVYQELIADRQQVTGRGI